MNDLEKISRGEIFYITSLSDTVGSEQKSGRPAVIVSNNMCNEFSPCVEICYLTLQEKKPLPTHVKLDRGPCVNSTILCEQVNTVSKERLGDYICTIPDDILDLVDKALIVSLGLQYIIDHDSNVVPGASTKELNDLRAEKVALETKVKELNEIVKSGNKKDGSADIAKHEAKVYKKLYNELLDKVIGNKI